MRFIMKSKVKKRCKPMLTGLLALSMLCGLLPQNTVSVSAATTAKTKVSSYGRLGNVDVGSKTKTGTWWKINVGSKTAFCLSLGKTCHTGNTYQVTDTHTWNQNTGGEKHGYYAKIIRFYVNDCNRAKKGFVLGQALIWAVSEGNTSEANLKNVIKQVKANTGYFPNKTVADLYKQIFQPTGAWEAQATMWEKTGATKGYQKLITVDADILQNPNYKTITDHTYYRQRITLHKQDEDGKGLGGIKFTLSADNLDDLYSFGKYDRSGESANSADEDDNTEFEVSGLTTDGGTVAWRMTYRLEADEMAYYTDNTLASMNADQKKAAKKALEDDGYKQGVHFGKNMTKAEAEDLIRKDLNSQIKDISNSYTLTEDSVGNNKNIFLDAEARILEEAVDSSYRKGGINACIGEQEVSRETVMNKLHTLEFPLLEPLKEKRRVSRLYIDADEDHVSLQYLEKKGDIKRPRVNTVMPKLIYVYEDVNFDGSKHELVNCHYFGGDYAGTEGTKELWQEVFDFITESYDEEVLEKIYINGDGADWIRTGAGMHAKARFVLDRFHMHKYIISATSHLKDSAQDARSEIYKAINGKRKWAAEEAFDKILHVTESETKAKAVESAKNYILGNWTGIMESVKTKDKSLQCSAEGHVSHIYSARMSSRPLGWSRTGADKMARLRIYRQNKRDILELVRYQKKELPLAAGAEEVIYSATQMLSAERRNRNRLGKLAGMPVYSIPYPQIKKIAALKNHIWRL